MTSVQPKKITSPLMQPKIALGGHWQSPTDFSDHQYAAFSAMAETSFGCVVYGYAADDKFNIYLSDNKTTVPTMQAYNDAVSLALGIYTINLEHDNSEVCKRLICNCKSH